MGGARAELDRIARTPVLRALLAVLLLAGLLTGPALRPAAADPGADLGITLTTPASFAAGTRGTATITVRNTGSGASATGRVNLSFSRSLTAVAGIAGSGTGWTCEMSSSSVSCDRPEGESLAIDGALPVLTVTFDVPHIPSVELEANAYDGDSADISTQNQFVRRTVPITGARYVDLVPTAVTVGAPWPTPGNARFTVTVKNDGTAPTVGPVQVSLNGAVSPITASGTGWLCQQPGSSTFTNVCTRSAVLAAGASAPVLTVETPTAGTSVAPSLNAIVVDDGPFRSNNSSYAFSPARQEVDGAITLTPTALPLEIGTDGEYQAVVRNQGTKSIPGPIEVNLQIGFPEAVGTGTGWTCQLATFPQTCTHAGPIAAGASLPVLRITGTVPDTTQLYSSAYVEVEGDDYTSNNGVSQYHQPVAEIDLDASVAWTSTRVTAGQPGSFTLRGRNIGTKAATGEISYTWSSDLQGATASGTGWDCDDFSYCTRPGPLAAGAELPPITVTGTVPTSSFDRRIDANGSLGNESDQSGPGVSYANAYAALVTPVDVRISISDGGASFDTDQPETYQVVVRNHGTVSAGGSTTVGISVPTGSPNVARTRVTGLVGTGWECDVPARTCTTDDPIPAGAAAPPITATVVVDGTESGTTSASVSVASAEDQMRGDNNASIQTTVTSHADVRVGLTADGAFVVGRTAKYKVAVTNVLATSAPGEVTARIDLGFQFASDGATGAGEGWTCGVASFRTLTCTHPGPVPGSGAIPVLTVTGQLQASSGVGSVRSSASVATPGDDLTGNNALSLTTNVGGETDLAVAIGEPAAPARFGQEVSVPVTVRNVDTTKAATGSMTLVIDRSSALGTSTATSTDPKWACTQAGTRWTCTHPGPVASGASLAPVVLKGTVGKTSNATLFLSASLTGEFDATTANNNASVSLPVTVPTDLAVDISDADADFPITGTGRYSVSVQNQGTAATTEPVVVMVDFLRDRVEDIVVTPSTWTCDTSAEPIRCTFTGSIAGGSSSGFTLDFAVTDTEATTMSVRARVDHPEDGRTDNDSESESTRLVEIQDAGIALTDGDVTINAPGTGTYTAVARNAGSVAVEGPISVRLSVDSGPGTPKAASGEGWDCDPVGEELVCLHDGPIPVRGTLPPITYTVDVTGSTARSIRARAQLGAPHDAVSSNNVDTEDTPIVVPADLAVGLVAGPMAVGVAGPVTVKVSNVGTGATIAPTQVRLDHPGSASGTGWSCSSDAVAVTCNTTTSVPAGGGTLPDLTWMVTPASSDQPEWTLGAKVSNVDDGQPANDSASVTVAVLLPVDLVVEVAPARTPYTAAATESFTTTVRNVGARASTGTVTVTINQSSAGFPQVPSGDGWECLTLGGTTVCEHAGPVAAGGALPPITSTFEVLVADYPRYSARVAVDNESDARSENDSADLSTPVRAVDLTVAVEDLGGDAPAPIGEHRQYRVVVGNEGGLAPPGAVTVTIHPGEGQLRGEAGNDDWLCTPDGADLTCSTTGTMPIPADGDLPPLPIDFYMGGAAYPTTSLLVTANAPGEADVLDNVDSVSTAITGAPDLVMELATDADAYDVGQEVEATLTVANQGSEPTTGPIHVLADQVRGLTFLGNAEDDPDWVCATDEEAWDCQATAESLASGAELPPLVLRFQVAVEGYPKVFLGAEVDNLSDEDPDNNSVLKELDINGVVDLEVNVNNTTPVAGADWATPVVVANVGSVAAPGPTTIEVTQFGAGVVPVSSAGTGWNCEPTATGFRCTNPTAVPAEGSLEPLVVTGRISDTAFDLGEKCRFADVGRGLERVCARVELDRVAVVGKVRNAADLASPEQQFGIEGRVVQPSDLDVDAGPDDAIYTGDQARFRIDVSRAGLADSEQLVSVRARFDCGQRFGATERGPQGGCEPGLTDLDVLSGLEVSGDGWTCQVDVDDDRAIVCTRPNAVGTLAPIFVTADMDPDFRGVFHLRPTVTNADDANPNNDHPSTQAIIDIRRLPDGRSDLTPEISKPRQREYTVGVNDVFTAQILNYGRSETNGTVTLTVELGNGFRFLRDQADDDWACAASARTVTCTSDEPIPVYEPYLQGPVSVPFVVGIDAAGMPIATHKLTVAYGNDPVATNNTREQVDAVFEGPVPTAVIGASRTVVPNPSTITFDASQSQNTGPTTKFRWDFGDGSSLFDEVVEHQYTRAGVYTATLRAYTGARYSTDKIRIVVYPNEPLVAVAGDDTVVAEGDPVEFDAGASRPLLGIQSFRWEFGDGDTATGRSVQHEYRDPGTYDVKLTVRIGSLTATDTMEVEVLPAGEVGDGKGLVVQVDDKNGDPVRLADVTVFDRNGRRFSGRADANGRAVLGTLPSGAYTAFAYRLGYKPGTGRATVVRGSGSGRVVLEPGDVGEATLEHRRLTRDEILAEGIDVDDPANQHVFQFEIVLTYAVYPDEPPIEEGQGEFIVNGEGEILEAPEDWVCDPVTNDCYDDSGPSTVILDEGEDPEGGPRIIVLILPGKAKFLKEFFEVTMLVSNLGPKGFSFTEGSATIDLPAGLALAPLAEPQGLTQEMDDIGSGKAGVARWIVRGDEEGEYDLGAAYSGVLDPVGSSVRLSAESVRPLKVWGADALNLRVRAQKQVRSGRPYRVTVGIENVSDVPMYNAGFELDELGGDGGFEYAPWTDRAPMTEEIAPHETWWYPVWLIPNFNGELIACNLCEGQAATARAAVPGAAGPADGDVDTGIFGPFATGGASGAASGVDPSAVEIEDVPDTAATFTATAAPAVDRLQWSPVDGATAYRVYRKVGGAIAPQPIAIATAGTTQADVPPIAGERSYVLGTVVAGEQQLVHPAASVSPADNQEPTAIDQQVATAPGSAVAVDVLADEVDPEGRPLTVTGSTQPEHGTVTCTTSGICTYTPEEGFEGTDTFEVTVEDADGSTTTQTVGVEVGDEANHPPTAVADAGGTTAGTPVEVDVLANDTDADGDGLEVTAASDPARGTVDCADDGTCTYDPDAGTSGVDVFTYTVEDGQGGVARAAVRVVVSPSAAGNRSPVAAFAVTADGAVASVDASASSDPDGSIAGYAWTFGDGGSGSGATTTHRYAASGTYAIELTVTDDLGATAKVTHEVAVSVPVTNQPPVAAFTSTADGRTVSLDAATSTDADGSIVSHLWDFGDGTSGAGKAVQHTYTAAGTFQVTLRVVDDDGAVGSRTQAVTVVEEAVNQSPTAAFSSTVAGRSASFDGSASADPDGSIAAFAWDFGDGTSGSGAKPVHDYAVDGTFTVVLTVTDDDGATAVLSKPVTVGSAPVNQPPTASFTATPSGLAVAVDAAASADGDGTIGSYAWTFGDGGTATGATASHTYATAGSFTITLTVTDDDGATASTTRQVTVSAGGTNQLPVVQFSVTSKDLTVTLDASGSSDPDGSLASFAWDFGDGPVTGQAGNGALRAATGQAGGSGVTISHTYTTAGTYTITLTVTDDDGGVSTLAKTATVTAPTTTSTTTTSTTSTSTTVAGGSSSTSSSTSTTTVGSSSTSTSTTSVTITVGAGGTAGTGGSQGRGGGLIPTTGSRYVDVILMFGLGLVLLGTGLRVQAQPTRRRR